MSGAPQRPTVARIATQAARTTPNLVALGTSLATALLLGNLLARGCGRLAVSPARRAHQHEPALLAQARRVGRRLARQLPAETSLADPALMLIVRAIRKGYDEIARVMAELPEPVRTQLACPRSRR